MRMGYSAGQVNDIKVVDGKEVWSLTEGGLTGANRGGVIKWSVGDPLHALRTFDANPLNSHEIVAGGTGMRMTVVNASQGKVVKHVSAGFCFPVLPGNAHHLDNAHLYTRSTILTR